jgi:para-nitrobenzyl esterase
VKAASFAQDIAQAWGPLPPPVIAAYPFASDGQARKARADLERDLRFGWDMWTWARLQAAAGGKVWLYRFTQAPPFPAGSVRAGWGASHFAELWYMFGHLDQESWAWRAADRRLSDAMVSYWANFVRSGDPNDAGLPRWPVFTLAGAQVLQLGDPIAVGGVPELPTLQVFDAVYAQVRGAPVPAH